MASAEYQISPELANMLWGNDSSDQGAYPDKFDKSAHEAMEAQRPDFDPIAQTAGDRPEHDSLPAMLDPAMDHEDTALRARRQDIDAKYQLLLDFIDRRGLEGILLTRADSLAWFTSGGDLSIDFTSEMGAAAIFINKKCRTLLADNVQSPRLFEEELAGLGFQLKERPWTEDPDDLLTTITRGRKVAADVPRTGLTDASKALRDLRYPMSPIERQRFRELGRTLTLAVEATCRNFQVNETEADIAGHLSHRLLREGVTPVSIRVAGDDRLARYRQPAFKAAAIRNKATIAVIGRRHGLCVAVSRTVAFGKLDAMVSTEHTLATMVDATCIYFSRPEEPVEAVFRRAKRIYEKFDCPHEWTLDYQGQQIGYSARESIFRPDSTAKLTHGMAIAWSPSVGSARSEDTVVVDNLGFEVVTEAQDWPKIEIVVKGFTLPRPGILIR